MSITDGDEDICVLMVGLIEMRLRERKRKRECVRTMCRERMETIFRRRDFDTRRKRSHVWYVIDLPEFGILEKSLEEENKFYYGWARWSLVKRFVNLSSTKTISS